MSKHKFKILSIDGGGIRGIIPATILKYIEEKTGKSTSGIFDLFAGTSTGGIIALGLNVPDRDKNKYSAADMLDLYKDNGGKIFGKRQGWRITRFLLSISPKILKDALEKPYRIEAFETILKDKFGALQLTQCLKNVLITTHDIHSGRPFYFNSRLAKKDIKENFLLTQVARSTSAAPTFFPPNIIGDYAFVDGGVFANNPAVLAYREAKILWAEQQENEGTLGFGEESRKTNNDLPFLMLSIGTGSTVHSSRIEGLDMKNSRSFKWIKPLVENVFMQSASESTHFTMPYLLPDFEDGTSRYIRLNIDVPENISKMDDASEKNIAALIAVANDFINENQAHLDEICEMLNPNLSQENPIV